MIIARSLGPEFYGDYTFLLSSFIAVMFLLDMGTSKAFFTFISQKPRGFVYILYYAIWKVFQFIVSVLLIGLVLPDDWLGAIWLGKERTLLLLAFAAIFLQQSAWQTIVSIGESLRMTHRLQWMNIALAGAFFVFVAGVWLTNLLTVRIIFMFIVFEYVLALGIAVKLFSIHKLKGEPLHFQSAINQYVVYCAPLVLFSVFGFGSQFADRWFLQKFGGSVEQGFYSVAYQFVAVCSITERSLSNIFWREIAEAHENSDVDRVRRLYQKASRLLYFGTAVMCGFLIPWSEDIIQLFLGGDFKGSVLPLVIMFLFPIHQSLSNTTDSLFLAAGKTKAQLYLGCVFWAVSIPVSYFVLAPRNAALTGLESGALGMALKIVILQIIIVNSKVWWISRDFKWKFDWVHQVVGLGGPLLLSWIAYEIIMGIGSFVSMGLILKVGAALILYSLMVGIFIWKLPWVAGMSQDEIKSETMKLRAYVVRKKQ